MSIIQSRADVSRLHIQQLEEWPMDPFNLARSFVESACRDFQGRLTLRHFHSEWYLYGPGHYLKYTEQSIRVMLTAFIKTYIDSNHCVDKHGVALKVTTAVVTNALQALAPMVAVAETVQIPTWLGDDRQLQLVALKNWLVDLGDLSTNELKVFENSPEWFSTVVLPYDYDPTATCPRWRQFVHEVMGGDEERIALLQEFYGYCLTRDTQHQKFLVLEGEGDNGKSVTLEILTQMIGEDNVSQVPLELFGARFQLTRSIGKLANICAEVGELSTVAEGVLKQFTGGDRMYFDRKGIAGVECYPTAKLVLATNSRPRFRDRSQGIWRRMILLPFRYTVPPERKDRKLVSKLKAELPGIFLWALEGLKRLRANGHFTEPAACREVLEEYRLESNPARVFLTENMSFLPGESVRCADVYKNYLEWSKQSGFEPLNVAQFGKEVSKQFPSVKRIRMTKKDDRAWRYAGLDYQSHVSAGAILFSGSPLEKAA
jgi:P4 family phage/plasmid primase-like protien